MGKLHTVIPESTIPWLKSQNMFWVATAPLSSSGHVNLSPKCTEGTFHIIDQTRVWYEDLTGSETISHLREPDNGRISILFHSFQGQPMIVRIYGKGSRAVIIVDIIQVMTTCGWSVSLYEFKTYRTKLHTWAEKLESHDQSHEKGMKKWWLTRNSKSIDGLPGLYTAFDVEGSLISTRLYPSQCSRQESALSFRVVDATGFYSGLVLGYNRRRDIIHLVHKCIDPGEENNHSCVYR